MKISHRKITASTQVARVPSPLDSVYEIISDEEFVDLTGCDDTSSIAEEIPGYDVKHLAWVAAKPEYVDILMNDGLDIVELVQEGGEPFLAYVVGDRIYAVYQDDIERLGIDLDENVTGSIDTGLDYWYLTKHGLGPGMMPNDAHVLDVVEDGWLTYILIDRLLTTEELNFYDMKEQTPPDELLSCSDADSKQYVTSSNDAYDDFLDYDEEDWNGWDHSMETVVPYIEQTLGVNTKLAETVWWWYDNEDAWEDYDSVEDFTSFLANDIWDMLDAADDADMADEIREAYLAMKEAEDIEPITTKTSAKEVSRTKDEINYVVSSDNVVGMSLVKYHNYKVVSDYRSGCWDVLDSTNKVVQDGFRSEYDAKDYIDSLITDVTGSEEVEGEEGDEFDEAPDQEFSSAETAVNGKQGKLPSGFKIAEIPTGALVLDYGGGTVESEQVAQNYLDQFDATEMLYDPFNQTPAHNREVIQKLRANGGADVAICSNVLNVIKEPEVRLDVLSKIKKLLKPGATAFITVYEGGGSGEGSATQNGKSWQNKKKTAGYLEEIQQVFPNAIRKGAKIIAPNTGDAAASTDIEASSSYKRISRYSEFDNGHVMFSYKKMSNEEAEEEARLASLDNPGEAFYVKYDDIMDPRSDWTWIDGKRYHYSDVDGAGRLKEDVSASIDMNNVDLDALKKGIEEGVREYFASPEGGWPEDELDQAVADYSKVEVIVNEDHVVVEVRAELSYEGMVNLSEILDKIVEQYDEDAYFEQVTGGIMEAYLWSNDAIEGATNITAGRYDAWNERMLAEHERRWLEPDDYEEPEEKDPLIAKFDFDFNVDVEEDGDWGPSEGEDPLFHAEDYSEEGVDEDRLLEDFLDLLIWNIPDKEGRYHVKGSAELEYDYDDADDKYPTYRSRYSRITDFEYSPAGKVESSTEVRASMTEEELDDAILNGKPFDIEDFHRYKVEPGINPDSIKAKDVELGDVISVEEDASEVNLGTVVKITSINDPAEDWIDFTFRGVVVDMLGRAGEQTTLKIGDEVVLHFDADEPIGPIVPV